MRKPRNKERDHERYMENRERILAQQKIYRDAHKPQKRAYRLKYEYEKRYGKPYYL